MIDNSTTANCSHCGEPLSTKHTGPCPKCGKTRKNVKVVINEIVNIRDEVEAIIKKNPLNEIKKAKNEKDYFKAITYTSTIIEFYGKQILISYFKKQNTEINSKKLERTNLESVIIMLYTHKLVEQRHYAKMMEIKKTRNDFIHGNYSIKQTSSQKREWENLIPKCLDVVKTLKLKLDELASSE